MSKRRGEENALRHSLDSLLHSFFIASSLSQLHCFLSLLLLGVRLMCTLSVHRVMEWTSSVKAKAKV